MTRVQRPKRFDLWLFMKKSALSGFVIFTFIAYVIDQKISEARQASTAQPADPASSAQAQSSLNPSYYALPKNNRTAGQPQTAQQPQQAQPTQPPAPTQAPPAQAPQGQYRDGNYNGPVTDAYYGAMQVEAVVQGGKLTQVQILQYPRDRRTSQRINSQALPWLESEAVQAQSANIDFISGATLSSQAFIESLQSALQTAKG